MRTHKLLAIFLDIGNVLVDSAVLIQKSTRVAAAKCAQDGFGVNPEAFEAAYLDLDRRTKRPHLNHLFGDRLIASATLENVQGRIDLRYVGTFLAYYREHLRSLLRPNDDVTGFFQALAKLNDSRIGIISDGTTDDQLEILTRLGILQLLDSELILISEDIGLEKTSVDIYVEGLRRAGSMPIHTFMIGDNPERDIEIPKSLGFRTIYFTKYVDQPPHTSRVSPDFICSELKQIVDIVVAVHKETLAS